jgi:hypothetical protein
MVVVGNSTMRDLFFRQSVYSIGQSPYRSIAELEMAAGKRTTTSLVETGRRCLLPIHPKARVYGAPIVSGHVGADAAACMLAADLAHEVAHRRHHGHRHQHGADRGQSRAHSGGLVPGRSRIRGRRHRLRHAGARWRHRRRAHRRRRPVPPAEWSAATVPQGICGSGLVALMSELLRTGRMNERGRFEDDGHRIDARRRKRDLLLGKRRQRTGAGQGRQCRGLQVVFSQFGSISIRLSVFYLAGGFGRHLNVEAATRIGLIPAIPPSRMVQIGNAAIEGATIALLSRAKRAGVGTAGPSGGTLPAGDSPPVLRFLRGRLPIPARGTCFSLSGERSSPCGVLR